MAAAGRGFGSSGWLLRRADARVMIRRERPHGSPGSLALPARPDEEAVAGIGGMAGAAGGGPVSGAFMVRSRCGGGQGVDAGAPLNSPRSVRTEKMAQASKRTAAGRPAASGASTIASPSLVAKATATTTIAAIGT